LISKPVIDVLLGAAATGEAGSATWDVQIRGLLLLFPPEELHRSEVVKGKFVDSPPPQKTGVGGNSE
jgi:hypothetical protein